MGPFAWRPPFPKALRGKETMTKRLSSSGTFIFLAGLVALTSVRMTVAAAAVHPDGYVEIRDRLKDVIISGGENISSVEVEGGGGRSWWEAAAVTRGAVRCSAWLGASVSSAIKLRLNRLNCIVLKTSCEMLKSVPHTE